MKEIPLSLSRCGGRGCPNPACFIESYVSERGSVVQVPWCADHAPKPSLSPNEIKWLADCKAAGFDPVEEIQRLRSQVAVLEQKKRKPPERNSPARETNGPKDGIT